MCDVISCELNFNFSTSCLHHRVQQEEKEQPMIPKLTVVEEDEPQHEQQHLQPIPSPNPEIQSIASTASSKPKASPKVRILSLKRDGHSRSNSSSLDIRRYSTDSVLGERLDTIGRRLSRDFDADLTASPPDLGHRFETFGKNNSESSKFDTFSGKSGITKSADDLDRTNSARERNKFDTFAGNTFANIKPTLAPKPNVKSQPKQRKPLNTDLYDEQSTFGNHSLSSNHHLQQQSSFDSYRETLHPAIYQYDRSEAELREKLHEELRVKYEKKSLLKAKPPRVPSIVGRARIRSHNPNDSMFSTPVPDVRDIRSPRNSLPQPPPRNFSEDDDDMQDPTYATIVPKNKLLGQTGNGIQLGRLSKEDLLDLSQKSESEINEFLCGKNNNNVRHPP